MHCGETFVKFPHEVFKMPATSTQRPFRILGVQQIAVGSEDKQALRHFWGDLLGLPIMGHFQSERENVDEDIARIGSGHLAVELDLMAPLRLDGSPRVHVPPLNHVGLWVDRLPEAVQWLQSQGVRFTPGGIRKGAAGHDVCFVHPKGNEQSPFGAVGVLLELVQAPPEVIAAFERAAQDPAEPSLANKKGGANQGGANMGGAA
jgi:lactoylglutathione lyase